MRVGDDVTLEVECRAICVKDPSSIVVYTGKVMSCADYDDANTIRLTSDNSNVPVRVIPLKNIQSVNGTPFSFEAQPQPKKHTVVGSKNAVYEVTIDPNGAHKCTCAAFQFRGGNCKHIQQLLSKSPN